MGRADRGPHPARLRCRQAHRRHRARYLQAAGAHGPRHADGHHVEQPVVVRSPPRALLHNHALSFHVRRPFRDAAYIILSHAPRFSREVARAPWSGRAVLGGAAESWAAKWARERRGGGWGIMCESTVAVGPAEGSCVRSWRRAVYVNVASRV